MPLAGFALHLSLSPAVTADAPKAKQPNIVFIFSDDGDYERYEITPKSEILL